CATVANGSHLYW
nr:immunoglobulin heavy chain junction region [Macaca mulatta]MOY26792.1 immunoglobulin heavy chain junction region [Macaca mulatta]MOY27698.1 immunoglobulin heavy chain junction region [Macaca mulatta]MOY30660.1 immunoglobulin heavy chain junction region [Macaca mulatta]